MSVYNAVVHVWIMSQDVGEPCRTHGKGPLYLAVESFVRKCNSNNNFAFFGIYSAVLNLIALYLPALPAERDGSLSSRATSASIPLFTYIHRQF